MLFRIIPVFFCLLCLSQISGALGHSNTDPGSTQVPTCESSDPNVEIDMQCLETQLKGEGLAGWVHAAVKDQLMLVFTWRRPGNFFVNVQLPMASKDPKIVEQIANLRRHDRILIRGEFFKNEAPIEHINVTELKVLEAYQGPEEDYAYDPALPAEIMNGSSLVGKVHIVANGGRVLVVEVGDRVYPVFNDKPELVAGLFRNDKIAIDYNVQFLPMRPSHLELDTASADPVRVLERIEDGHGTEITLTGPLVMFPESPQIKFNVFALRVEDSDQVQRNFTIVNFADFDLFFAIRDKLQEAWDKHIATMTYDRNKFINRSVMLTVRGTKNVVSPDQANPQIMPASLDDVEITIQ
jgi:hypothetical protein